MAEDVKWIKLKVGMFDGESFKKIKRAKIGGEKFRDKLTAIWFELMDFAGKCNHAGAFVNSREIPYKDLEDIATMLDRETEELELCMAFYINEGMIEIVDDVYLLTNWAMYQNEAKLQEIRDKRNAKQAKWRAKQKALLSGEENEEDVDQEDGLPVDQEDGLQSGLPSISSSYSESGSNICSSNSISYEDIKNLYNSTCVSFPRCTVLSEARKKAIKARFASGYKEDDFQSLFMKAEASSFLKGRNDRNWMASFDWLIKDANMAKVLSGNYDDHGGGQGGVNSSDTAENRQYGTWV